MLENEDKFLKSVEDWKHAALTHAHATERCRLKHATIFSRSEAKTADGKKAEADIETSDARLDRDLLEVGRDAAYHTMIFYRGSAGEKEASR